MAWTPTQKVITARAIPATLLSFFETNQEDAFAWAGRPGLKTFGLFANNVIEARRAQKPIYPAISILGDGDAQTFGDDVLTAAYQCTFQLHIVGSSPDDVVTDARAYAQAVCSMIANCPLEANTGATKAVIDSLEIEFDELGSNEKQNEFLQLVQIRVVVQLTGSMHV